MRVPAAQNNVGLFIHVCEQGEQEVMTNKYGFMDWRKYCLNSSFARCGSNRYLPDKEHDQRAETRDVQLRLCRLQWLCLP